MWRTGDRPVPPCHPSRNHYPVPNRQPATLGRPRRDYDSTSSSKSGGQRHQLVHISSTSHHNRVESFLELACTILEPIGDDAGSAQHELTNGTQEERSAPPAW